MIAPVVVPLAYVERIELPAPRERRRDAIEVSRRVRAAHAAAVQAQDAKRAMVGHAPSDRSLEPHNWRAGAREFSFANRIRPETAACPYFGHISGRRGMGAQFFKMLIAEIFEPLDIDIQRIARASWPTSTFSRPILP